MGIKGSQQIVFLSSASQLGDVIDAMDSYAESSDSIAYTVDRYHSIHRDLKKEFRKISVIENCLYLVKNTLPSS